MSVKIRVLTPHIYATWTHIHIHTHNYPVQLLHKLYKQLFSISVFQVCPHSCCSANHAVQSMLLLKDDHTTSSLLVYRTWAKQNKHLIKCYSINQRHFVHVKHRVEKYCTSVKVNFIRTIQFQMTLTWSPEYVWPIIISQAVCTCMITNIRPTFYYKETWGLF